tara:strand:- start:1743 stop:3077 length:1335 start_codon:yes stop_codon:yes gene_type:complete
MSSEPEYTESEKDKMVDKERRERFATHPTRFQKKLDRIIGAKSKSERVHYDQLNSFEKVVYNFLDLNIYMWHQLKAAVKGVGSFLKFFAPRLNIKIEHVHSGKEPDGKEKAPAPQKEPEQATKQQEIKALETTKHLEKEIQKKDKKAVNDKEVVDGKVRRDRQFEQDVANGLYSNPEDNVIIDEFVGGIAHEDQETSVKPDKVLSEAKVAPTYVSNIKKGSIQLEGLDKEDGIELILGDVVGIEKIKLASEPVGPTLDNGEEPAKARDEDLKVSDMEGVFAESPGPNETTELVQLKEIPAILGRERMLIVASENKQVPIVANEKLGAFHNLVKDIADLRFTLKFDERHGVPKFDELVLDGKKVGLDKLLDSYEQEGLEKRNTPISKAELSKTMDTLIKDTVKEVEPKVEDRKETEKEYYDRVRKQLVHNGRIPGDPNNGPSMEM